MNKIQLYKRLFALIFFSFLLLSIFNITTSYFTAEQAGRTIILEKLRIVSTQVSKLIDGEQHEKISNQYNNKNEITHIAQYPEYAAVHKVLVEAQELYQLNSPIYTFVKSKEAPGKMEFIATSSERPYFRHLYTTFPADKYKELDRGGILDMYESNSEKWLSAFYPIRDTKGEVVAYLQVDEKFDVFLAGVRNYIYKVIIMNLLGLGLILLILLPMLKKIVKQEEHQKNKLRTSLEEITQLSEQLQENEVALKENAVKLKQSNTDLNDFAHIASHDLKAPLRNIQAFSNLLKRKEDQLDKDGKEFLKFITSSTERAQQLITGLLNYSTADKGIAKSTYFEMTKAVKEAVVGLKTNLDERNAQLIVHDLPSVNGNQLLITQVFQNLISNGIKYNQSNKAVIEIGSGEHEQKGIFIYVRDNGIGIPKEHQMDVFSMFKRLHGMREYEGSGIGLAFCKKVITNYGGEIWLDSEPDMGSTFYFTLSGMELGNTQQSLETVAATSIYG